MIPIKDVNHKLSEFLDDADLFSLSQVNTYYHRIFDEAYWRRRFFHNFSNFLTDGQKYNLYDESWSKYYRLLYTWSRKPTYNAVVFAIEKDRADLLSIIYKKNSLKYENTVYDWSKKMSNFMTPVSEAVSQDSIHCFRLIVKNLNYYIPELSLNDAIICSAHKIVEELVNYANNRAIISMMRQDCLICAGLLEPYIEKHIDKVIDYLFQNPEFVRGITENVNKCFDLFVHKLSLDEMDHYKKEALNRNRYDVIKALTKYTTPFRPK